MECTAIGYLYNIGRLPTDSMRLYVGLKPQSYELHQYNPSDSFLDVMDFGGVITKGIIRSSVRSYVVPVGQVKLVNSIPLGQM
jgi:hypothetical protein